MPKYAQSYDLTQVHGGYAHPEGDMGGESGLLESLHVTKLGLGLGLGLDLGLACLRACTCRKLAPGGALFTCFCGGCLRRQRRSPWPPSGGLGAGLLGLDHSPPCQVAALRRACTNPSPDPNPNPSPDLIQESLHVLDTSLDPMLWTQPALTGESPG